VHNIDDYKIYVVNGFSWLKTGSSYEIVVLVP